MSVSTSTFRKRNKKIEEGDHIEVLVENELQNFDHSFRAKYDADPSEQSDADVEPCVVDYWSAKDASRPIIRIVINVCLPASVLRIHGGFFGGMGMGKRFSASFRFGIS